jgi:hypothetical protein
MHGAPRQRCRHRLDSTHVCAPPASVEAAVPDRTRLRGPPPPHEAAPRQRALFPVLEEAWTSGAALLLLRQADPARRAQAPRRGQLPAALRGRARGAPRLASIPALPRRRRLRAPRAVPHGLQRARARRFFATIVLRAPMRAGKHRT